MIGVKNAKQPVARQEVEAALAERELGTSHRPSCHSLLCHYELAGGTEKHSPVVRACNPSAHLRTGS